MTGDSGQVETPAEAAPSESLGARVRAALQTGKELLDLLVVDQSLTTAGSLAFTTVLSMVPVLAVSFALLKAIVGSGEVAAKVRDWMLSSFLADSVQDVTPIIESLLERAGSGAIGIVGFTVLMVTSLSLFMSVEKAFNRVWRVPISRPLHRRLTAFYSVITLTPTLIGLGIASSAWMVAGLERVPFGISIGASLLPWALEIVALLLMYKLLPHTQVQWRAAVAGAVLAAVVFNLSKAGFNYYITAIYAGSVSAKVYGSFALVPIFFLWVYLIWLIVLGGAEFAYMFQNRASFSAALRRRGKRRSLPWSPTGYLVTRVFVEIAHEFRSHGGGVSPLELPNTLQLPIEEVQQTLDLLREGGLVLQVESDEEGSLLVPAKALDQVKVNDLYALTEIEGYRTGDLPLLPHTRTLEERLGEARAAAYEILDCNIQQFLDDREG